MDRIFSMFICIFTNCSTVGADCTVAVAAVNKAGFAVEHTSLIPVGESKASVPAPGGFRTTDQARLQTTY